jgi:hypothetical protein
LAALVEAVQLTTHQIDPTASRATAVHLERARGTTYTEIVSGGGPLVPDTLHATVKELHDAISRLRRAQARALYAEGLSMHHIARLFQVSRQRVSALLRAGAAVVETD